MTWIKPLYEVLYAPARVFTSMKEKPQWLAALLVVMITTVLVTAIIMKPLVMPEQRERMMKRLAENPEMSPDVRERVMARMDSPLVYWTGLLGAAVGQPLALLIAALVFWGLFSFLGGKAGFGHMFSATVHGALVTVPASIIKVPLMFALGTVRVQTSLALMLPSDLEETFMFRLLSQVDIFAIWSLIIMATGFSLYSGVKSRTSFGAVFGLWTLWILASSALGGLFHFGPR
jgi:hypothetical protein